MRTERFSEGNRRNMNGKLVACGRISNGEVSRQLDESQFSNICLSEMMLGKVEQHLKGTVRMDDDLFGQITDHVIGCSSCAGKLERLPILSGQLIAMVVDTESIHTSEPPSWSQQMNQLQTRPGFNYAII